MCCPHIFPFCLARCKRTCSSLLFAKVSSCRLNEIKIPRYASSARRAEFPLPRAARLALDNDGQGSQGLEG